MSRFTERDRERIRNQLIEAGRDLFTQFGFERTRISDLTEEAGIGTSTFYQFFDSKEALYVEVLLAERESLEAQIAEAVKAVDTPREEVRVLLKTTLSEVRSNPLISTLIVDGELRALQDRIADAKVPDDPISSDTRHSELPFAKRWAELDAFRYDDPELIDQLLMSLVFTARSRNAPIGADNDVAYEQVEDAMIETIVDGLFADG
ncbi:transcription regulator [Halorubrum saccharovorum DSM 1137]|uniref:Transcription regulator n=1 Tax=Halorubrum saccharovorum DSM 1137 TaxID=1227484 RepID=M0E129_9EURY|nr:TetR/AcrR family transcriptional regulator [Halorubrum saccharovorum]ELZ40657.1 transcription regulator [Halorubrum saccharovorum DSM 1137]